MNLFVQSLVIHDYKGLRTPSLAHYFKAYFFFLNKKSLSGSDPKVYQSQRKNFFFLCPTLFQKIQNYPTFLKNCKNTLLLGTTQFAVARYPKILGMELLYLATPSSDVLKYFFPRSITSLLQVAMQYVLFFFSSTQLIFVELFFCLIFKYLS